jgi:hypothetical protein
MVVSVDIFKFLTIFFRFSLRHLFTCWNSVGSIDLEILKKVECLFKCKFETIPAILCSENVFSILFVSLNE